MTRISVILLSITCAVICGCSHPIEIVGQGDVTSASGSRNCSLEEHSAGLDNCVKNFAIGAYKETYTGAARAGWQFRRWGNYCGTALNNQCSFDVDAATVFNFWGATLPPLQAVFRSSENSGFTTLIVGESFLMPVAMGIAALAGEADFHEHTTTTFLGEGALGAPQAFWNNPGQRAAVQAVLAGGDVELFGMSYDPLSPTIDGYKKWINYALQSNPDTRFFIAIPWNRNPASFNAAEYEAAYRATELRVYSLVDALRVKYPGVDFYAIPMGRSAVELYKLYDGEKLAEVLTLIGASDESIFQDEPGRSGDILTALSQLVWLGAIYDVDLEDYDFDLDLNYSGDLRVVAQEIVNGQNARYRAPPEIDIDTDGDGIVDRLDSSPRGKPNVLVLMADDLGFNDLAVNNGNTTIDTPNMDQLAREGVRFTRHYAHAVCSPARAAFLTGLYAERAGYSPNGRGMPSELITLPERLREAGYTTWHIGKWHIGDLDRTAWPDRQGFDHWLGFLNQWRLGGVRVNGNLQLTTPTYINPWLEGDTEPGKRFTGHLEDILTNKAIAVISDLNAAPAPWFLNLWFYAPHNPIQPASEFAAKYPATDAGRYQALLNQLDTNVGRIMAHLENIGALDNTIVVLVSDNGGTNLLMDNNAPYYGQKGAVTEGGLRTPLIIRWPDESLNGQVFSDTVNIQDIYPTLLSALGLSEPENLDGVSFYASLQNREPVPQQDHFWEIGTSYSVLSADNRWRFYQPLPFWGIEFEPFLYDFEQDPTATIFVQPIPVAQQTVMRDSYKAWYRDIHTVRTAFAPAANGSGVLTGMGFLRTPGFGGYTFGIGLPDAYSGPVASQGDIWNLHRTGNSVVAQFGAIVLSGDIVPGNSCHSIVVSGSFERKVASFAPPDRITLMMYVDGQASIPEIHDGFLQVSDPAIATVIGDPTATANSVALPPPVILNTLLNESTPWTLASFSEDLCSGP